MAMALPCFLLAVAPASNHALSLAATAAGSRSLVDQARMIREIKNGKESKRARKRLQAMDTQQPLLDNDALSAALFDDDFTNSLEDAVLNLKQNVNGPSSAKSRAEEFDRFMEEDASVASIVQENLKPGSLVDEVTQNKGPEALLQKEAADRRKSRLARNSAIMDDDSRHALSYDSASPAPLASMPITKLSKPRSAAKSKPSTTKKSTLLSREQEYALARTIQSGAQVHKLKAEYEAANHEPLSKRKWAELANMPSNELRKLISDYRTAKQELVSSNMGLVNAVVRNYSRKAKYRGVSMDELMQEGSLGLIRAAELFDPEKGLRFSTYATIWIKGTLSNSNSMDDMITLPQRERVLWNKVRQAWQDMADESGDRSSVTRGKPSMSSAKDIAARLGMKQSVIEEHLAKMNCVSSILSLDYQYTTSTRSGYTNEKQEGLSALVGTDADLAEQAQLKADVVAGLVRNLTEREVTLMRLRYGLEDGTEYSLKECAQKMGISRETVRLLQHACLKKLREASNMKSLQEYLLTVA